MTNPSGTVMSGSVDPETLYTKQNCIGKVGIQDLSAITLTYP